MDERHATTRVDLVWWIAEHGRLFVMLRQELKHEHSWARPKKGGKNVVNQGSTCKGPEAEISRRSWKKDDVAKVPRVGGMVRDQLVACWGVIFFSCLPPNFFLILSSIFQAQICGPLHYVPWKPKGNGDIERMLGGRVYFQLFIFSPLKLIAEINT